MLFLYKVYQRSQMDTGGLAHGEEPNVGIKRMRNDNYARIHKLVPIERVEKEIKIKKNKPSFPVIKRLQFPLILS